MTQLPPAEDLPTLYRDRAFWGMTTTQFFGAFNDNLFKQMMLLLVLELTATDRQAMAMFVFSVPFVVFSGLAGYLSDRYSKRRIIVLSKVAEIGVMLLGLVVFAMYDSTGMFGLMVVLALMGAQSAFFGPGKYGILPELLRKEDLPRANGVVLMTTFIAIILGIVCAGTLLDKLLKPGDPSSMWRASTICVLIAVVGTWTSLFIRQVRAAKPSLEFQPASLTISGDTLGVLRSDRALCMALLASSMFWLVAGLVPSSVNALGKFQFGLNAERTSLMTGSMAIGIAIGAVVAGKASHGRINFRLVMIGSWGIIACLLTLSLPGDTHGQLLGFGGSIAALISLGVFAGLFAIPIQVFIQARPPEDQKGRIIAVMNQANFTAIMISAGVYFVFQSIVEAMEWQHSAKFGFTALMMLPVALFYRPKNEADNSPELAQG